MPCSTDVSINAMVLVDDAISADYEADKSTDGNGAVLNPTKVTDGILALKAAAIWPEEGGTPAFNDEAATVYMEIVPTTLLDRFQLYAAGVMYLPHPLSLDRSVCYFGRDVETEEQQAEMTCILKEAGVLGKIKMVPLSLLRLAFDTNDQEALAELPELYDSYFLHHKCTTLLVLRKLLLEKKKDAIWAKPIHLKDALNATVAWINSEKDGYIVKVGHTGLTDEQLQQNIAAALGYIEAWEVSFPKGIGSVRSVQLKTGTSEAVSIHQDNSDEVPAVVEDETQLALSAEVIAETVSLLTTAADWPKEETAPAFTDEAATAYLNVFPRRKTIPADTYFGVLRLPHPLSVNRRVCYIGNDVETEEQQAEMTQKLKEAGVLGKIKMIPGSLVEMAAKNGENAAIAQLVQLYDTHLVEKQIRTTLHWKKLLPAFLKNEKYALDAVPSDFETSLKKSAIWITSSNNGFVVKVGHSGLTEEQLQQNIAAAMDFFKRWDVLFPKGIASMKSVQLRSGTGKGISILQDGHFKVGQVQGPTIGDKKPKKPVPQAVASRKKRGGVKHKRPADAKTGDRTVPMKQRREC